MTSHQKSPDIYLSMPHPCSYLPGKTATTLFIDPRFALDETAFNRFTRQGFRRSGDLIYRPHCRSCSECVPVRIPVHRFRPNRGQRRVRARNRDLVVTRCEAAFVQEHFDLYLRYQARRHADGGMDDPDPQKYRHFLLGSQVDTAFFEMRVDQKLLGVAVVDHLPDAISAVYTFFEPDESARGLGVYALLWEIEYARRTGRNWIYLGYWIKDSPKMAYKTNYRPLEAYRHGRWIALVA